MLLTAVRNAVVVLVDKSFREDRLDFFLFEAAIVRSPSGKSVTLCVTQDANN